MTGAAPPGVPGLPALPALVVGRVQHVRHRPVRHAFTHRHYHWLVDLDAAPRPPRWLAPVATIEPHDHLSRPETFAGLKAEALALLAAEGIDLGPQPRLLLQAHARVLGHAFDPMSAFWALDAGGTLRAVILEVHNTYGGRHTYTVALDEAGRAEVDKAFFVSPFNDTSGGYAVRATLRDDLVSVALRLSTADGPLITASVTGTPEPATTGTVLRAVLRHPLMTQQVTTLIRAHGIWLWLRRLPVRPRTQDRGSLLTSAATHQEAS